MPLAREKRGIPGLPQPLGDGDLLQRELLGIRGGNQLALSVAGKEFCHPRARGISASHEARPRWRTDGACCVTLGEPHAALRQRVNVRRLVERLGIIRADVHVAEIIGQDQYDVGLRTLESGGGR
jgi:hypothetical protein